MVAGAVSALSGAVKSVAEIFPTGCRMKAEAPVQVREIAPPPAPAPVEEGGGEGWRGRTLESRPEPPPIVYHMEEPKKRNLWVWPALLVFGVLLMMFARKLKREGAGV